MKKLLLIFGFLILAALIVYAASGGTEWITATSYNQTFGNTTGTNFSSTSLNVVNGRLLLDGNVTQFDNFDGHPSWNESTTPDTPEQIDWGVKANGATSDVYNNSYGYLSRAIIGNSATGAFELTNLAGGTIPFPVPSIDGISVSVSFLSFYSAYNRISFCFYSAAMSGGVAVGCPQYVFGGSDSAIWVEVTNTTLSLNNKTGTGNILSLANYSINFSENVWKNLTFWHNTTHIKAWVDNYTLGINDSSVANNYFGIGLDKVGGGAAYPISLNIDNLTIYNGTPPLQFRNGSYFSTILNASKKVDSVRLTFFNDSFPSSNNLSCKGFDANHANVFNINLAAITALSTAINGIGINCSGATTNQYESFVINEYFLELNLLPPSLSSNNSNFTSIRRNEVLGIFANWSHSEGLSFVFAETNMSGSAVNTTIKAPSGNVSYNLTFNLTNSGATRGQVFYVKLYANSTTGVFNNTLSRMIFTVSNTNPSVNVSINSTFEAGSNLTPLQTNFSDADSDSWVANMTRWFRNGTRIAALDNSSYVNVSNLTHNQHWNFSMRVYDGFDWSDWSSNSTIIINDSTVPSVFGNSSLATTVDTAGNITVNVSDTGSNITSVTVEVTNDSGSNGDKVNYTMTFLSGSNVAGVRSVWSYSYTSGGARVFTARFWATDFAGNVYKTPDDTLSWTASAAGGGGDGGGGGGGGSSTTVNIQQIISSQDSTKRLLVIQTPVGAVSTDQLMWGGQSRKVPFYVFSLANFSQQARLSCISSEGICSYLTLEKTIINLPVSDQPQKTFFTLVLPEQDFGFSRQSGIIFAADVSSGANATFKVTVTTVPRALGIPFYAFSTLFQFPQIRAGQGSFPFPNVFVFLVLPELLMIIFAAQSRNPAVLRHRLLFISLSSLIVMIFAVTASYLLTTSSLVV